MQTFQVMGKRGEQGRVSLQFDDGPETVFDFNLDYADDGARLLHQFEAAMPAAPKTVTYRRRSELNGTTSDSEKTFAFYDLFPRFTHVLQREDLSFCRRVLKLYRETALADEPLFYIYRRRLLREDEWLAALPETAEAHGVQVPDPLWSFAKLNIEPDMGGGVWAAPGRKLINTKYSADDLMPNVTFATQKDAEWSGLSPERYDITMALYARSVCVAGDANHFSGVIWDPVGLTEEEARICGTSQAIKGPDGTFWRVKDDFWHTPRSVRDHTGVVASADFVVRQVFCEYFLRDIHDILRDDEVVAENTILIDSTCPAPVIYLQDPNGYNPVDVRLYEPI